MRIQSLPTTQIRFEGNKKTTPAPVTFGRMGAGPDHYTGPSLIDSLKDLYRFLKNIVTDTFKKKPPIE